MSFNRFVLAAAIVLAAAAPASGQLGIGESPTGLLDLKPPVLSIASAPARVIRGGTAFSFRWTLSEPLPGPPGSHVARLLVGGVAADSSIESSLTGSFDWKCAIPENSVAGCRFEVAAVDARGNRARAQSEVFTILASWTDAPAIAVSAALLQPPRPNPGNPMTEVSWVLPAS